MNSGEDNKKDLQNSLLTAFLGEGYSSIPPEAKNYSKAISDDITREMKIREAKREKAKAEKAEADRKAREILREHTRRVQDGDLLEAEILKGIQGGEKLGLLFLKAIELIGKLTGEKVFPEQARQDYLEIYGEAFGDAVALEEKLRETKRRLKKLLKAVEREQPEDARKRIQRAIAEHKREAERLEEKLRDGE